eukprot:symbB.v1.2.035772.t1/scaffold4889.1/size33415/2
MAKAKAKGKAKAKAKAKGKAKAKAKAKAAAQPAEPAEGEEVEEKPKAPREKAVSLRTKVQKILETRDIDEVMAEIREKVAACQELVKEAEGAIC